MNEKTLATILIIDDDIDFIEQLKIQLEAANFSVISAGGESEAEQILAKTRPDLVIVDLMMEHFDGGFVLCHHIKAKDATIPVILATAVTNQTGLSFDAVTPGERSWVKADAILSKPIRIEQVLREIHRLLPFKD